MKVLVVGGGGREHALCWAIATSPRCKALWCAPGNAGIAEVATCLPGVGAEDLDAILDACRAHAIDLVVVGPEAPLVAGLVDRLEAAGIAAVGPSAAAARLEGSNGRWRSPPAPLPAAPTAWTAYRARRCRPAPPDRPSGAGSNGRSRPPSAG